MDGKRASASNETKISSGSSLKSFIPFTKSDEFLHEKGESLRTGRTMGMTKEERAS